MMGWETAHGLCFLLICYSLQCGVKEAMTGDFLFSKGPVMAEACISPGDGLCFSLGSLGTHTMLSLSQGQDLPDDGVFVREAKASPCHVSSLCCPWKTSQALRTRCRTHGRGGMVSGGGALEVFLSRLGLGRGQQAGLRTAFRHDSRQGRKAGSRWGMPLSIVPLPNPRQKDPEHHTLPGLEGAGWGLPPQETQTSINCHFQEGGQN